MRTIQRRARTLWALSAVSVLAACGSDRLPAGPHAVPTREGEFARATEAFGPLFVDEGEFDAEAGVRPWSSWWYPLRDTYLFESAGARKSPLEKYDRFVQKTSGQSPDAAVYERDNLHDPNATSWEGLCNAWAAASLLEPEPRRPVAHGGLTFEVGDQKALLIKSYELVDGLRQIGQRFNGDRAGVYEDIYPEQFHRVIQHQLFEQSRPIIMDKDPGVAVWNTPIWKAQARIAQDPSDPYVMRVSLWLVGASPFVDSYDFVGTLPVAFEYTYDLYGNRDEQGRFAVAFGAWTGPSIDFHPDFVTVIPESGTGHRSRNSKIDPAMVRSIVNGSAGEADGK